MDEGTYATDPVKLIPAKWGDLVIAEPKTGPSAGTKLTGKKLIK